MPLLYLLSLKVVRCRSCEEATHSSLNSTFVERPSGETP